MSISLDDALALEQLDTKLREILPSLYGDSYQDVIPVSMGSAPLKYGSDGKVAWDAMWDSYCDLAMAGGPPHRGTLLQPASAAEIQAAPQQYEQAAEEICRGISLVTRLDARPSTRPGWISVPCYGQGMAAWLVRTIVMENVLARHHEETLFLPAGPEFRIHKEIRNVITAAAKTCHYWLEHTPAEQQQSIDDFFANAAQDSELLQSALPEEILAEPEAYRAVVERISSGIGHALQLPCFSGRYTGWIGIECPSVQRAVWMMRAMVVENVLARRENEVVFIPASPRFVERERCERLIRTFGHLYHLSIVSRV
jgi:hypothetical protein